MWSSAVGGHCRDSGGMMFTASYASAACCDTMPYHNPGTCPSSSPSASSSPLAGPGQQLAAVSHQRNHSLVDYDTVDIRNHSSSSSCSSSSLGGVHVVYAATNVCNNLEGVAELRKEKSRDAARSRRGKENYEFYELAKLLPLPAAIASQLDKASIVRLAISYLKLRHFSSHGEPMWRRDSGSLARTCSTTEYPGTGSATKGTPCKGVPCATNRSGMIVQDIFESYHGTHVLQSMDGFVFALARDGRFLYVSETVSIYLGLSQVEMTGSSIFDYVHVDDYEELADQLGLKMRPGNYSSLEENDSISSSTELSSDELEDDEHDEVEDSDKEILAMGSSCYEDHRCFCVRLKSTLTKRGVHVKTSGYRVVQIMARTRKTTQTSLSMTSSRKSRSSRHSMLGLTAMAVALPSPSISELIVDNDTFVLRLNAQFKVMYCEPRMSEMLDLSADDLIHNSLYDFCHVEDLMKLRKAHVDLLNKGQSLTDYYRLMIKRGGYVWVQTCATVICNAKSNNEEQNIVAITYLLSAPELIGCVMTVNQRCLTAAVNASEVCRRVVQIHKDEPYSDSVQNDQFATRVEHCSLAVKSLQQFEHTKNQSSVNSHVNPTNIINRSPRTQLSPRIIPAAADPIAVDLVTSNGSHPSRVDAVKLTCAQTLDTKYISSGESLNETDTTRKVSALKRKCVAHDLRLAKKNNGRHHILQQIASGDACKEDPIDKLCVLPGVAVTSVLHAGGGSEFPISPDVQKTSDASSSSSPQIGRNFSKDANLAVAATTTTSATSASALKQEALLSKAKRNEPSTLQLTMSTSAAQHIPSSPFTASSQPDIDCNISINKNNSSPAKNCWSISSADACRSSLQHEQQPLHSQQPQRPLEKAKCEKQAENHSTEQQQQRQQQEQSPSAKKIRQQHTTRKLPLSAHEHLNCKNPDFITQSKTTHRQPTNCNRCQIKQGCPFDHNDAGTQKLRDGCSFLDQPVPMTTRNLSHCLSSVLELERAMIKHLPADTDMTPGSVCEGVRLCSQSLLSPLLKPSSVGHAPSYLPATTLLRSLYANRETVIRSSSVYASLGSYQYDSTGFISRSYNCNNEYDNDMDDEDDDYKVSSQSTVIGDSASIAESSCSMMPGVYYGVVGYPYDVLESTMSPDHYVNTPASSVSPANINCKYAEAPFQLIRDDVADNGHGVAFPPFFPMSYGMCPRDQTNCSRDMCVPSGPQSSVSALLSSVHGDDHIIGSNNNYISKSCCEVASRRENYAAASSHNPCAMLPEALPREYCGGKKAWDVDGLHESAEEIEVDRTRYDVVGIHGYP